MEKNQSPWFKLKDEDPGHEFILLTEIGIIGLDRKNDDSSKRELTKT